jgi:two-component system sensor histidine kinase BaeS
MTVTAFVPRLEEHGLELQTDIEGPGPTITGDPGRLQQLLNNLLENSLRYAQPGHLRLRCRSTNGHVLLELEDAGPGVGAELLPRLFDRFVRGDDSRNRATGGAGLGLAICRKIVEAHGGTITAANGDAGGLLIKISLPRAPTAESGA